MIIYVFIAVIIIASLILSYLKENRRRFFLRLFSFLIIAVLIIYEMNTNHCGPIITYSSHGSYAKTFGKYEKSKIIINRYSSLFTLIVSDTAFSNSFLHFSDERGFNDIHLNENDTGIDTAYYDGNVLKILVKSYSGSFVPCTLTTEYNDSFYCMNDTQISLEGSKVRHIRLTANDLNPYNEYFILNNKPVILLTDSTYSKVFQQSIFYLQGMYPEYEIRGALYRDKKIISSTRVYNGIIFTFCSDYLNDSILTICADYENEDQRLIISRFLEQKHLFNERIKNPFNSLNTDYPLNIIRFIIILFRIYFVTILLFTALLATLVITEYIDNN